MSRIVLDRALVRATSQAHGLAIVSRATRQTVNLAKELVPRKTGRLANSIGESTFVQRDRVYSRVGTKVGYARPIHDGSRRHTITPRRAKALAFYWERIGEHVIFMSVSHPGNENYPFLTAALYRAARANGMIVTRL